MVTATELRHPVISAAMTAAAAVTGMEVVFIGGLTEETFTFQRLYGEWPGLGEGVSFDRADSFCARLLDGAPHATSDAAADTWYSNLSVIDTYHIKSYVGVPIRDPDGRPLGTLCGIDHDSVPVEESAIAVLRELASVIAAQVGSTAAVGTAAVGSTAPADDTTVVGIAVRRTADGWRVDGTDEPVEADLVNAMVLADLLTEAIEAGGRPPRPKGPLDEVDRLRLAVTQLEHALAARVVVEQAIGVLAERQRIAPRAAFERLRKVARTRGRKVHHLAREVVDSAQRPGVPLPPELGGRR